MKVNVKKVNVKVNVNKINVKVNVNKIKDKVNFYSCNYSSAHRISRSRTESVGSPHTHNYLS